MDCRNKKYAKQNLDLRFLITTAFSPHQQKLAVVKIFLDAEKYYRQARLYVKDSSQFQHEAVALLAFEKAISLYQEVTPQFHGTKKQVVYIRLTRCYTKISRIYFNFGVSHDPIEEQHLFFENRKRCQEYINLALKSWEQIDGDYLLIKNTLIQDIRIREGELNECGYRYLSCSTAMIMGVISKTEKSKSGSEEKESRMDCSPPSSMFRDEGQSEKTEEGGDDQVFNQVKTLKA